jgi:hypothetical protein
VEEPEPEATEEASSSSELEDIAAAVRYTLQESIEQHLEWKSRRGGGGGADSKSQTAEKRFRNFASWRQAIGLVSHASTSDLCSLPRLLKN